MTARHYAGISLRHDTIDNPGTPNTYSLMFGLSLIRPWHGGYVQVYLSIHLGIVEYNCLLLKFLHWWV